MGLNWNRFCLRLWVWLSGEKDRAGSIITRNWKVATLNTTDEFVSQSIMKLTITFVSNLTKLEDWWKSGSGGCLIGDGKRLALVSWSLIYILHFRYDINLIDFFRVL